MGIGGGVGVERTTASVGSVVDVVEGGVGVGTGVRIGVAAAVGRTLGEGVGLGTTGVALIDAGGGAEDDGGARLGRAD